MRSVMIRAAIALPLLSGVALAQMPGGPPPAVGVVKVLPTAIVETADFIGRIQAVDRVALTARVTAFLDQRLFTEGAEVVAGDLLYRLERAPFEAAVAQQEAAVADVGARLTNAVAHLARAQKLLATPAGLRATYEDAQASQESLAALYAAAQAQLQTARIALSYTEIRAPVGGKISRGSVTPGNAVSPTSGTLATIVSQDPMYVVFPVASRTLTALQTRYAAKGGIGAVAVRLKLPDGSPYAQTGEIDYIDPTVSPTTDTVTVRARIANPALRPPEPGKSVDRPLLDGAFVAVSVEGIQPVAALGIPRAAVLSDQQGDYVYVLGDGNKVEQRRIRLGQSTAAMAVVAAGLKDGETVIAEGIQKVRPGAVVAPAPIGAPPNPTAPPAAPAGK